MDKSSTDLNALESFLRYIQLQYGATEAARWWKKVAHKYPLLIYDTVEERIKERGETEQARD